jgi:hypothetical protein
LASTAYAAQRIEKSCEYGFSTISRFRGGYNKPGHMKQTNPSMATWKTKVRKQTKKQDRTRQTWVEGW